MFDERTAIRDTARNVQRVKEIIEAYNTYARKSTLDQYMNQLVTSIMANSIVLRANRLHESFERFRKYDAEYAETLREYNSAYRAFLSMVETLRGGQGISGRASRSGAYPNNYLFNDVLLTPASLNTSTSAANALAAASPISPASSTITSWPSATPN